MSKHLFTLNSPSCDLVFEGQLHQKLLFPFWVSTYGLNYTSAFVCVIECNDKLSLKRSLSLSLHANHKKRLEIVAADAPVTALHYIIKNPVGEKYQYLLGQNLGFLFISPAEIWEVGIQKI